MQKYRDIKDLLWGRKCIFGRATDHWQRIEFQNRGALHVHLLLWVDDGVTDRSDKVVATVPRYSDEKALVLWAKVLKYQVHNYREGWCYKKGKSELCKYGFPYKLQDRDCLSDSVPDLTEMFPLTRGMGFPSPPGCVLLRNSCRGFLTGPGTFCTGGCCASANETP